MNRSFEKVKAGVIGFLNDQMFPLPENFGDDDSLLEKRVLDSTGSLELVLFLETLYGIKVEDNEFTVENLDSFKKIFLYLERKLNENL